MAVLIRSILSTIGGTNTLRHRPNFSPHGSGKLYLPEHSATSIRVLIPIPVDMDVC